MTSTAQMPWNTLIEYHAFNASTEEQDQIWTAYREWFEDLERFVVDVGMSEAGFAPTSQATHRYLWVLGVNAIGENDPAYILERMGRAPEFPRHWPETHPAEGTIQLLSELHDLKPLRLSVDEYAVLARDMRKQAIETLGKSEAFATL